MREIFPMELFSDVPSEIHRCAVFGGIADRGRQTTENGTLRRSAVRGRFSLKQKRLYPKWDRTISVFERTTVQNK
jgi:hypothetical protein